MSSQKYIDNEADFWKEHFVHIQHKNMVRTNATPLRLADCKEAFEAFAASHPAARIKTEFSASYCTFEVPLTAAIKLRLFIQSSIKGSLMQKHGADYVKLCDAKFPYNPLPEIDEFLSHLPSYLEELGQSLENKARSERRQKIAMEFIKAYASTYIPKSRPWKIECDSSSNGTFTLSFPEENKTLNLTESDFIQKISGI